ncbi:hypothetical protein N7488_005246 [Penicillium malachiteum]|nr:hypothetical protein N7488_005246 [Penicillium malachiteum]
MKSEFTHPVTNFLPPHRRHVQQMRGSGNNDKCSIPASQMFKIRDMVHAKGAPHTSRMLSRAEHKVVDDQLIEAIEEIY